PTAPLAVADGGLDWQWVVAGNSTDAGCPGARRFPFVDGFAPPYQPCALQEADPYREQQQDGGWREWFGFGDRAARDPATEPPPAPAPEPPPPPPQPGY